MENTALAGSESEIDISGGAQEPASPSAGFDAILYSGSGSGRHTRKLIDVEAAYKNMTEQLAKVGRKEIERRIQFGRSAARNRAILKCVAEYVGSSPSELQERLIEILTVDFMDTPITDMEIIQALR